MEQSKFNIAWSGLILSLFIFFQFQLHNLIGDPSISQAYLDKFIPLGWFCIIVAFISLAFAWVKEPGTAHLPTLATSNSYIPIKRTWLKFVIIGVFAILILSSVTTLKVQVFPVPEPLEVGFSISPLQEAYYSSVIPAFYEDFMWGIILPTLIFNFLWLLFILAWKIDVRGSMGSYMGVMMVAIFISSIGYGLLIPGFATAHRLVYMENITAYLTAAAFMFIQAMIYALTGIFFPIAHLLHNLILSLGWVVALSIGGVSISSIMLFMKFKKGRWQYNGTHK